MVVVLGLRREKKEKERKKAIKKKNLHTIRPKILMCFGLNVLCQTMI